MAAQVQDQHKLQWTHKCDECEMFFICAGPVPGLPHHCYCRQEIGQFFWHGEQTHRLMFYCNRYCHEASMGESSDEDENNPYNGLGCK